MLITADENIGSNNSFLIAGARTPIGKLCGALASLTAVEMGASAISSAIARAGISPEDVDQVIMGNVVQAGVGPNPARRAAVAAGIPMSTPAVTVNSLCLSGLQAVIDADRLIRSGEADVVVAGGMESMTNAPHISHSIRSGVKYGSVRLDDALDRDALTCAFDGMSMGAATDRYLVDTGHSRAEQDRFAARSHRLAAAAAAGGVFDDEIAPVTVHRRGEVTTVKADEGIRADTTESSLAALRPAFDRDGTITAGSSSQLSDGAAAVVVMSGAKARQLGLTGLGALGGSAFVAGPDPSLLHQPARAIARAVQRDGRLAVGDLDLVEINEAFAGVALASIDQLGVDDAIVNVNGGAIALGHPVGMSGTRLLLSLGLSLRARGGGIGVAALCGGGGQGNALILRVS